MLFHQLQLFACALIARHYAGQPTDEDLPAVVGTTARA
jgi:hypothetical protein